MNEEDLGDLVGPREAMMIMRYCKAITQLPQGFQQGTMHGFLRQLSDSIPNVTDHQLAILQNYMKSVGATSELQLYKMNEEDLATQVGAKEAKMIMRYCNAKMLRRALVSQNPREMGITENWLK